MRKPPSTPAPATDPRHAWLRLGALAAGVFAALLSVAALSGFSAQRVHDWVDGFGVAAPVVFIVVSASLTCALFPGPVLAGASGLLVAMAVLGLALLRREVRPPGSGTCSSSPASPSAGPR